MIANLVLKGCQLVNENCVYCINGQTVQTVTFLNYSSIAFKMLLVNIYRLMLERYISDVL